MSATNLKSKQIFLIIGSAISWFAVTFQLYLIILNRVASVPETILRFFSFFTVLTNILVAVCFTLLLIQSKSKVGKFLAKPVNLTAVAVYISVVSIVYNLVLRFLWSPQGLQLVVDELLHTAIPILYVVYWAIFVPKNDLKWRNIRVWMIYPAIYCVYILIRGAISGFYPYPFIDAGDLGYGQVLINIAGLILGFMFVSVVFVGSTKFRKSSNS